MADFTKERALGYSNLTKVLPIAAQRREPEYSLSVLPRGAVGRRVRRYLTMWLSCCYQHSAFDSLNMW